MLNIETQYKAIGSNSSKNLHDFVDSHEIKFALEARDRLKEVIKQNPFASSVRCFAYCEVVDLAEIANKLKNFNKSSLYTILLFILVCEVNIRLNHGKVSNPDDTIAVSVNFYKHLNTLCQMLET